MKRGLVGLRVLTAGDFLLVLIILICLAAASWILLRPCC
jgi:hypothetical protein